MTKNLSLDEKLAAIGIMVATTSLKKQEIANVDIEATLAEAFVAMADEENLRIISPVFTWIEEHGSSVIIEKLIKVIGGPKEEQRKISLAGLVAKFALHNGHKRWLTVTKKFTNPSSPRTIGPKAMTESLIALRGEEEWAKGSGFRVAKGVISTNKKWILSRKDLAKLHHQYRNRLIYGAQWRADIITAYEQGAKNPTEASRMSGASYEPCHRVKGELEAAGLLAS